MYRHRDVRAPQTMYRHRDVRARQTMYRDRGRCTKQAQTMYQLFRLVQYMTRVICHYTRTSTVLHPGVRMYQIYTRPLAKHYKTTPTRCQRSNTMPTYTGSVVVQPADIGDRKGDNFTYIGDEQQILFTLKQGSYAKVHILPGMPMVLCPERNGRQGRWAHFTYSLTDAEDPDGKVRLFKECVRCK